MTKVEYLLCQKMKAGEICDWHELSVEEQGLLIAMKNRGWIWLDQAGNVRIEPTGYTALQAHEEELERLEQEAKQQADGNTKEKQEKAADTRRSWWQFWLGILLGWLLGGITFEDFVRFFMEVYEMVVGLFQ